MFLKDYILNVDKKYKKVFFSGISFDSNRVKKNNIFFAVKGSKVDGNNYIYKYRDGSNFKLKGSPRNTAGWNSVEATGHIVEKIGPILATKYSEIN